MSFIQKFELRLPVPQLNGLDQSLAGREIASGRPVTIHLLDRGMADENEYLLREISKLHSEYRVCFLETGNFQGTQYVVTDVLDGNPPIQSAGMTPREYALTSLTPITVGMVVSFKRAGTVKEIPSSISAGIDGLYHQVRFASQSELVQIKRLTQRVKPFLLFASIIPLIIDHFGRRRRLQTAGFRQFIVLKHYFKKASFHDQPAISPTV